MVSGLHVTVLGNYCILSTITLGVQGARVVIIGLCVCLYQFYHDEICCIPRVQCTSRNVNKDMGFFMLSSRLQSFTEMPHSIILASLN